MHKLILASGAGSSLVVTITIIVDTSARKWLRQLSIQYQQ